MAFSSFWRESSPEMNPLHVMNLLDVCSTSELEHARVLLLKVHTHAPQYTQSDGNYHGCPRSEMTGMQQLLSFVLGMHSSGRGPPMCRSKHLVYSIGNEPLIFHFAICIHSFIARSSCGDGESFTFCSPRRGGIVRFIWWRSYRGRSFYCQCPSNMHRHTQSGSRLRQQSAARIVVHRRLRNKLCIILRHGLEYTKSGNSENRVFYSGLHGGM